MARRPRLVSAVHVVPSVDDLDLPLDVDAFVPPLSGFDLRPGRSVLVGVAAAAWLIAVAALVGTVVPTSSDWTAVPLALAQGVLLFALWRFGTLHDDLCVIGLVGGVLVAVAAVALPWDDDRPFHVFLGVFGIFMIGVAYLTWAKMQRLAPGHEADRARLSSTAATPEQAASARVHPAVVRAGGTYRILGGSVTYVDTSGVEHTAPLATSAVTKILLEVGDEIGPDAPCRVWHDEDHAVVITRVVSTS